MKQNESPERFERWDAGQPALGGQDSPLRRVAAGPLITADQLLGPEDMGYDMDGFGIGALVLRHEGEVAPDEQPDVAPEVAGEVPGAPHADEPAPAAEDVVAGGGKKPPMPPPDTPIAGGADDPEHNDIPGEGRERSRPEAPKPVPPKVRTAVVDEAGVSQLRLLALMRMAQEPGRIWTPGQVLREINTMQGEEPVWLLPKGSIPMVRTFMATFGDKDLVKTEGGGWMPPTTAEDTLLTGLALARWQFRYPRIPYQVLLGSRYRSTPPDSEHGVSSLRLGIIEQAVAGASSRGIADELSEPSARVAGAVQDLTRRGILKVRTDAGDDTRTLLIDPPSKDLLLSRATLPTTRAIWEEATRLGVERIVSLSSDVFLDRIVRAHPELDREAVWRSLVRSLSEGRIRPVTFAQPADPRGSNLVTVTSEFMQPVKELLTLMRELTTVTPTQRRVLKGRADALMANESAVRRLIYIAREHSGR